MHDDPHPTILIVEDDPDEEAIITRALRHSRCQIVVAHSTDEAADYLFSDAEIPVPRVVVTDLKVAPGGGAELIAHMRAQAKTRFVPIVVLTGSASDDQIDSLYRLGANSFLEKPLSFDEFSATIERIVGYWGILNRSVGPTEKAAGFMYTL